MDFEDGLNKFQKKRLIERLNLDFYTELEKKNSEKDNFYRNFSKLLDTFVNELYNSGVLFYGLKILLPFSKSDDPEFWYFVHLQIEKWVNDFRDKIELIEFCYITIELPMNMVSNKDIKDLATYQKKQFGYDNTPHLNVLIGIRSLIGKNKFHFNEIKKVFNLPYIECFINELKTPEIIKKYWYFIIKQKNFKFHRFCQYSRFFESLYGTISDLELQYDENHFAFNLDEDLSSKNSDVEGIKDRNPDNDGILNYLLTLYFYKFNLAISNNFLYKKLLEAQNSWEFFDSILYIKKNNIVILNELKELFPQQLGHLKTFKLLDRKFNAFFYNITKNNQYLPEVRFNHDLIEFSDGFYFLSENKFEVSISSVTNFYTQRFSANTFFFCKNNPPVNWLGLFSQKSNEVESFCYEIGKSFNSPSMECSKILSVFGSFFLKKNFSFKISVIDGDSFFGFTDNSVYYFNYLKSKKIIILRELEETSSKNCGSKAINFFFDSGLSETQIDITNRMFIIELLIYAFSVKITSSSSKKLNSIITLELFQIIIYCNNIFLESTRKINE